MARGYPVAGSIVPGAVDAFSNAYNQARRTGLAENSEAIQAALAAARLDQFNEQTRTRQALPGDIAALGQAQFEAPAPAAPPSVATGTTAFPAAAPVEPDSEAAAFAPRTPTPMTVVPPAPAALPPEAGPAEPPGLTLRMLAQNPTVGPERVARLLGTPQGQLALKSRDLVSEEEFRRRQIRRDARQQAQEKFTAAQQAYLSGDPQQAAQGLLLEAAGARALAQAVDNPDRLLARADDLTKKAVDALKEPDERRKFAADIQRILGALDAWKKNPGEATAHDQLFEALSTAQSKAGQQRADEITAKLAGGIIDEIKASPTADFDTALAQAIDQRRQAGKMTDLVGVYQDAAAANPAAFSRYLNWAMVHAKDVPKPLLAVVFGDTNVDNDIAHEADSLATSVYKLSRGTPEWMQKVRELKTELTKERSPGLTTADRTSAVQLRGQLQSDLERAENQLREIRTRMPAGPVMPGDTEALTNAEARVRQAQTALDAHTGDMRTRGYLAREAPAPDTEATPPPPGATVEQAVAELKRLLGRGYSKAAAMELMRRKGWK